MSNRSNSNEMTIGVTEQVIANYEKAGQDLGASGSQYAKMSKTGKFSFGASNSAIEPTEDWAVDLRQLQRGWICWKSNKVAGETMAPMSSGRVIQEDTLTDHGPYDRDGDGWRGQASVVLKSLDRGDQVVFKTSSKGGIGAIGSLSAKFADLLKRGERDKLVPIVRLRCDSYKHDSYGEIFFPVFDIQRWVGFEALAVGGTEEQRTEAREDDDRRDDYDRKMAEDDGKSQASEEEYEEEEYEEEEEAPPPPKKRRKRRTANTENAQDSL